MKRGGPLRRKAGLSRGDGFKRRSSLSKTGGAPRQRTPIPPRSVQRVAQDRERSRLRCQAEEDGHLTCQAAGPIARAHPELRRCWGPLDWHEPLSRGRGGSITDPANRMWACCGHHSWLTGHPAEAEALGLLLPSRR